MELLRILAITCLILQIGARNWKTAHHKQLELAPNSGYPKVESTDTTLHINAGRHSEPEAEIKTIVRKIRGAAFGAGCPTGKVRCESMCCDINTKKPE